MSIIIINDLPIECELVRDFNGFCKLYKQHSLKYVCRILVPWYDDNERYFVIKLKKDTIKKILNHDGYSTNETSMFSSVLCPTLSRINDWLDNPELLKCFDFYRNCLFEEICYIFFSNEIMSYLTNNIVLEGKNFKWTKENKLLYGLSQILYAVHTVCVYRIRTNN